MKIENDKFVGLTYNLHVQGNEAPVETVEESDPMTFIAGSGMLLPKFEENLMNLSKGDAFEFSILSDDAYGQYDLESIFDLPMNIFMNDGKPREDLLILGNVLPIRDNSGKVMNGKIIEIGTDQVKMDFNHPLAGKDLMFKGKIVEVRDATEEDMNSFYKHDESGCGGCSCDSGSCGSDCG